MMPSHLQVFLLAANFKSDRMTSHKHNLAAKMNFSRITSTSEAETSVTEKAECLLATGEDEKTNLVL